MSDPESIPIDTEGFTLRRMSQRKLSGDAFLFILTPQPDHQVIASSFIHIALEHMVRVFQRFWWFDDTRQIFGWRREL